MFRCDREEKVKISSGTNNAADDAEGGVDVHLKNAFRTHFRPRLRFRICVSNDCISMSTEALN